MRIQFEPCNVATRWPCCVCGGHTEKHSVYAMAKNDDGSEWGFVCEQCIGAGADGMKERMRQQVERAFEAARVACHNAALFEREVFTCPTMADWEQAENDWWERCRRGPVRDEKGGAR